MRTTMTARNHTTPPSTTRDTSWRESGRCAETDPEAFFPDPGETSEPAKRICWSCDVRQACLEYALTHNERFGIWGGLSMRERRQPRRTTTRSMR